MNDSSTKAWAIAVTLSEEVDAEDTSAQVIAEDSDIIRFLHGRIGAVVFDEKVRRSADLILARRAVRLEPEAWHAMITGARRGVGNLRWRRRLDGAEAAVQMHSQLMELTCGTDRDQPGEADDFRALAARSLDDLLAHLFDGNVNVDRVDAEQVVDWIDDAGINHSLAEAALRTAMEQRHRIKDDELIMLGEADEWSPLLTAITSALHRRRYEQEES
ncbi:hypothetical protein AB0M83_27175 [Amycolatopsis sp. NPDC051106]|uniref:hypothetical protein n=1 Tax=unclassified Amycolatopsis TaxID=2618356 RepID=UPI00342827FB